MEAAGPFALYFMILGILRNASSNQDVCRYADWRLFRSVVGSLTG